MPLPIPVFPGFPLLRPLIIPFPPMLVTLTPLVFPLFFLLLLVELPVKLVHLPPVFLYSGCDLQGVFVCVEEERKGGGVGAREKGSYFPVTAPVAFLGRRETLTQ